MKDLVRYWNTIRYLRVEQLYGRVQHRLRRRAVNSAPPPPLRALPGKWVSPAPRRRSLVDLDTVTLLNETRSLSRHGWDDDALPKLWRYNLHYFDDLNAEGAPERREWHGMHLARWIAENAPAHGSGWEPYPTSLRIVNWIKWALGGATLTSSVRHSLAVQARWLEERLERHLLGNHLFANAKALVFAGVFFEGSEAERWLALGAALLEREIPEQILGDGGQFERSPMYHALALEDILDLCNLTAAAAEALPPRWREAARSWRERAGPMRDWLAAMSHPDGEISFFNDAAMGVAPPPATLEDYALRLGLGSRPPIAPGILYLADSGYIRVSRGEAVAILDVAPIGPDYLPGHAHADTLSFELSLRGQRVLVNSGVSQYGADAERLRQRSTAAHNTVVIDDHDSSEVWSGFRVARRARPTGLAIQDGSSIRINCAHDGYTRLPGRPVHSRQWAFDDAAVTIEDRIAGLYHHAVARYHLHPSVTPLIDPNDEVVILRCGDGTVVRITADGGSIRRESAIWHPEFGRSEPTTCLAVELAHRTLRFRLDWSVT